MRKGSKSGGSRSPRMSRTERGKLLAQLRWDAKRIAAHFGLTYTAIEAEAPRVKRRYGACFSDGRIKIRLNHARTGRPLKYSSMIDTLCHELAHLKHFNHGPRFRAFYQDILAWARKAGIYQPGLRTNLDPFASPSTIPEAATTPAGSVMSSSDAQERLAELMSTVFAAASLEPLDSQAPAGAGVGMSLQASNRPGGLVHAADAPGSGRVPGQETTATAGPQPTTNETEPAATRPQPSSDREASTATRPQPSADREASTAQRQPATGREVTETNRTDRVPEQRTAKPRPRKSRRTYEQMWLFE